MNKLSMIFVVSLSLVCGCARKGSTVMQPPAAPPLVGDFSTVPIEKFYPMISIASHETGEVIISFHAEPGYGIRAVAIKQSSGSSRLDQAALGMIGTRISPEIGFGYKKDLSASIVFELSSCGSVAHSAAVDYKVHLCLEPHPELSQIANSRKTPTCYGSPYAVAKNASYVATVLPALDNPLATPPSIAAPQASKNRIRIQTNPLDNPPMEISQIRRGFVGSYVGAFINDGLSSWLGIDLERMQAISIERHIHDKNGRAGPEPTFNWRDEQSFERKWIDKSTGRVEVETVLLKQLDTDEANAFVCIANKIWELNPVRDYELTQLTDTLASSSDLLDTNTVDGKTTASSAAVLSPSPLDVVIKEISNSMSVPTYGKTNAKR
jgi:hypothetical protein